MGEAKIDTSDLMQLEVLEYERTPLGWICLQQRPMPSDPSTMVTEITLDHQFLMSSHNTVSERALSRLALEMHPGSELRVLVGGLGLGFTAHEVLRSDRVAAVQVIEFLPQVVEWFERGLLPLSKELKAEGRASIRRGDVYSILAGNVEQQFDLILIDVDHSPDENLGTTNSDFYTAAGLERAKQHLATNGVLGVWSYAECSPFADALSATFREVRVERVAFRNPVIEEDETNWLFFARD